MAPTAAPRTNPLSVSWPINAPVMAPNKVPTAKNNANSFKQKLPNYQTVLKNEVFYCILNNSKKSDIIYSINMITKSMDQKGPFVYMPKPFSHWRNPIKQ